MSRPIRCRRCGAPFVRDCFTSFVRWWRWCPCCQGPLPPTGGVLATDQGQVFPYLAEAA